MIRSVWLFICVFLSLNFAAGQEMREGENFPLYPVPESVRLKGGVELPERVDNSKHKFFPELISQYSWSCNQASSIGYTFTYEINRARNADGNFPENQYAYLYPWNFNVTPSIQAPGVSYFDTWEIIKAGGCPNVIDYPYQSTGVYWMSGFDKYDRAMRNRVLNNYSMPVGTPEDLLILKRYLYDHLEGSQYGGLASFQIASGGMQIHYLGTQSRDPGAPLITGFGVNVGHAMTIVGYDDRIGIDLNADGELTNDVDINGDRIIDLHDYEKGGIDRLQLLGRLAVSSWKSLRGLQRAGTVWVPGRILESLCAYSCGIKIL